MMPFLNFHPIAFQNPLLNKIKCKIKSRAGPNQFIGKLVLEKNIKKMTQTKQFHLDPNTGKLWWAT